MANEEYASNRPPRARPLWIAATFALVTMLVSGAGFWFYFQQRSALNDHVLKEMETVSELKAHSTASLVASYRSVLARSSQSEYFIDAAEHLGAAGRGSSELEAMRRRLSLDLSDSGYSAVALLDSSGRIVESVSFDKKPVDVSPLDLAVIGPAAAGDVRTTDLYLNAEARPTLDFLAPLVADGPGISAPFGWLLARVDPTLALYPELQHWPVPSATGETLLVRQEGDEILFLNELRHRKDTALTLKVPISEELPAGRAVSGDTRPLFGVDYRGVDVVADGARVEGTSWFVISKMDADEVQAPLRKTALLTLLAVLLALIAAGVSATWTWVRTAQAADHLLHEQQEARAAAETALGRNEERLRLAMEATSDAVWDLDVPSGLLEVNARYYIMLGFDEGAWPATLETMTDLIHPDDSESALEAINSMVHGGASGASFEMRLKTREGSWKWVLSRARAVSRDEVGTARRIVGTHVDLTEAKEHELQLNRYRLHLEELVEERTAEVRVANDRLEATNEELATLNEELRANNEQMDQTNEELACVNEELLSSNEELATLNAEVTRANEQVESMNVELAKASRAKSDFLASVSHELRTPLNSIIGFSGILLQGLAGPINEEQRKQLGMVDYSGRHLLALVNDILDLERVESGTIDLNLQEIDPSAVAASVVETLRPLADKRGLELDCNAKRAPKCITADARALEQILVNLIANAIKYTDSGSVSVSVIEKSKETLFEIRDTGIGVSAEHQETIFDEFVQVRSECREEPEGAGGSGTGLGLAVSRRLAAMLGGQIDLASVVGEGSTFTLILPTTGCRT